MASTLPRKKRFAASIAGWSLVVLCLVVCNAFPARAQQHGQYQPGEVGLNAGILPSPGFTYADLDMNYTTSQFNDASGHAATPIAGKANVSYWIVINEFYWVWNTKFLGADVGHAVFVPTAANGSLTLPQLGVGATTTWGLGDSYFAPLALGWHRKRADLQLWEGFLVPTGRYTPGDRTNIGSGYFGNWVIAGATVYLTKNKGTSANVFTDWEYHGQKQGTNGTYIRPGQTFTDEWGVGQILPLKKNFSQLLQIGVAGYDQWQITANGGTISGPLGTILPATALPFYSVHAVGGNLNYIVPEKNFALFFKYYHEYSAYGHTKGTTITFGGSWTLRVPKPQPPPAR